MPRSPDEAWTELRNLLGARPGGFTEGDDLTAAVGERTLFVRVLPFGDAAVVQVMTPLLAGVANTDGLAEAVATASLTWTRPLVFDDEDGRQVLLVHRFHADQLRADVLDHAIATVAADAEQLDPELEAAFGATWSLEPPS